MDEKGGIYEVEKEGVLFRYNIDNDLNDIALSLLKTLKDHFQHNITGNDIIPFCEEFECEFMSEIKTSRVTNEIGNFLILCLARLFISIEMHRVYMNNYEGFDTIDEQKIINMTKLLVGTLNKGYLL